MSEKRKDNKNRILRKGESQRKNLSYQYRYSDMRGGTKYIYASTLEELREKEKEIERDLLDGIDHTSQSIILSKLVRQYLDSKRNLKQVTIESYEGNFRILQQSDIGSMQIGDIKRSDAKRFAVSLFDRGLSYGSIKGVFKIINPAVDMAVEDDILRKNPFHFRLSDVIPNNTSERIPLTREQQYDFMKFAQSYRGGKHYDMLVILMETGVRASELCGITKKDIDFENHTISINKQVQKTSNGYEVSTPKSKSGVRVLPLTERACQCLRHTLNNRCPKVEVIIDGYSGFVFVKPNGYPFTNRSVRAVIMSIERNYRKQGKTDMPHISPHVLRHTYCTNLENDGIDIKSLQYLMGHANASISLNTYSHATAESAQKAFREIV